ncbi:MAG: HAD hydrolase-like protein [Clostridia bacterium]|nr:HAD hydrolase-like protein [Clostridia bacterium]
MGKKLIIFTDIGDTIIDEGTEQRQGEVVIRAECIPGARETTLKLHDAGYTIAMVADGLTASFHNMMNLHGLSHVFSAWVISEEVGEDKPGAKMFETAMQRLSLTDADKDRIIMVGNNVIRDMRGANRFGIRSVLMDWSDRRSFEPQLPEDVPTYRIHTPSELFALAEKLNAELEAGEAR